MKRNPRKRLSRTPPSSLVGFEDGLPDVTQPFPMSLLSGLLDEDEPLSKRPVAPDLSGSPLPGGVPEEWVPSAQLLDHDSACHAVLDEIPLPADPEHLLRLLLRNDPRHPFSLFCRQPHGQSQLEMVPQVARAIKDNTHLQRLRICCPDLHLPCGPLERSAMWYLAQALKSNSWLQHLTLLGSHFSGGTATDLLSGLSHNTSLFGLSFEHNCIGSQGVQLLSGFLASRHCRLGSLDLSHNRLEKDVLLLAAALPSCASLAKLSLEMSGIHTEGAEALGRALATNSSLKTLKLARNYIGTEGMQGLCHGLRSNSSLTMLDLTCTLLGDAELCLMASALRHNATLLHLDLSENPIGDDALHAFAELMASNSLGAITSLALRQIWPAGSQEDHHGALALFSALAGNTQIRRLDIGSNCLSNNMVQLLNEALAANSSLKKLHLKRCLFESKPALCSLVSALMRSRGLVFLSMKGVPLNRDAGQALARGLAGNRTLRRLFINASRISADSTAQIVQLLHTNAALRVLELKSAVLSEATVRCLAAAMSKNETLRVLSLSPSSPNLGLIHDALANCNYSLQMLSVSIIPGQLWVWKSVDASIKRNTANMILRISTLRTLLMKRLFPTLMMRMLALAQLEEEFQ
ncbi:MAG: hypothetical protein Q8P67_10105 [archaeon]|nr:hypothetical protein [archaeon]